MSMTNWKAAGVAGAIFAASFTFTAAEATTIDFNPGTYLLATTAGGSPSATLTVTVSGGLADFAVLGGSSFSVPDGSAPSGFVFGDNPYFANPGGFSPPAYVAFYTAADGGGFSVNSSIPPTAGNNIIAPLYGSTSSNGQLFTAVPEPSTWAMLLLGFAALGFAGYRTSRKAAAVAA
jgi:hypothetical protein